jgi:AcrR family transcriptional regulator
VGLRERAKQDKLKRIEKAARRLFKKGGYQSTTMRAIADTAEVAVGTLYLYFPDKLDLLTHLYTTDLERITTQAIERLRPEVALVDGCMTVFEAVFDFWAQDVVLARTLVKEIMFVPQARGPVGVIMRLQGKLALLVASCQQRGELRADVAPPLVASEVFGRYFWCLTNWLGGRFPGPPQLGALLRMSLELMVRGLAV